MKRIYLFAAAMLAWSGLNAQYTDLTPVDGEGVKEWNVDRGDFALVDIDNDGDLDVIFSGNNPDVTGVGYTMIWTNDGNGNLTELSQLEGNEIMMGRSGNIAVGDINGDGNLDLLFVGFGNGSSTTQRGIALNDGTGHFTLADKAQYPMTDIDPAHSCGFADFNNDGLLDYYVFANWKDDGDGDDSTWQTNNIIYYQNADGTFREDRTALALPAYKFNETGATVMDFNRDGAPDIWLNTNNQTQSCTNRQEAERLNLLLINNGFGGFTELNLNVGTDLKFYKSNGTASWGDIDGDGYPELLHNGDGYLCTGENTDRMFRLYKNNGGTGIGMAFDFGAAEVARQNSVNNGSYIVDWDGDGVMDLITAGWSETRSAQVLDWWKGDANNRTGAFTMQSFGSNIPGFSEQGLRIGDIDGDGKPDLFANGYSSQDGRRLGWIKNASASAAALPGAPLNASAEAQGTDVSFKWEAPEGFSGAAGLTYNLSLYNRTTGKWMYNPMSDDNGKRKVGGLMGNVGNPDIATNDGFWLYGLPAGEYEWKVQAINGQYMGGAFTAAATFTIGTSGVASVEDYNPAVLVKDNILSIVGMQGEAQTVNVYSISGALLNTAAFNDNIDLQLPQAGIYMVEVRAADGGQYITKVVVK